MSVLTLATAALTSSSAFSGSTADNPWTFSFLSKRTEVSSAFEDAQQMIEALSEEDFFLMPKSVIRQIEEELSSSKPKASQAFKWPFNSEEDFESLSNSGWTFRKFR